jgi:hypothetical protein
MIPYECRICRTPGTMVCEACQLLEEEAKRQGKSMRQFGILDRRTQVNIGKREISLDELREEVE